MDFNDRLIKLLIACVLVAVWFIIIPIPEFTRLFSTALVGLTLGDIAGALFWMLGTLVVGDVAFASWYVAVTGEKWWSE